MYSSRASRLTSATHRKGDVSTLIGQPQNDDSGVRAGRILAGITEIEVERDEQPALGRRLAADYKIGGAAEVLVEHGASVVAERFKQRLGRPWKVLVELEPHDPDGMSG
jgi:hypothetical protein